MGNASAGYCDLEFDLDSGKRGSRTVHVEELLCQLTGAEAALVVNNNAAGVVLALSVLARRKEVIVSRGEAVEIGGGFRIPDVMRQSGAKLVEVGTTNCTYRTDYDAAITSRTAALMRVHSSNFRVMGFTRGVALEDLAVMARQREILLLDDQGSGCFVDTAPFGLAPEPLVQDSVVAGSSLVCFSGDKLVGGPQAGVVVGRRELIDKMRRHPLMRAMRLDRIRLAALSATLIHYLKGEAMEKIPVWRMIATPLSQLEQRTRRWVHAIDGRCWITDGESVVGGGSLPGATLPTKLVAVRGGGRVAESLRRGAVPVIGRVEKELLLLDPRTVLPEEDSQVIEALKAALT
jgi:L-seryl-tRNA(Ser) seleniumtransferase